MYISIFELSISKTDEGLQCE